jgi:hypothetical protein
MSYKNLFSPVSGPDRFPSQSLKLKKQPSVFKAHRSNNDRQKACHTFRLWKQTSVDGEEPTLHPL